VTARTEPDQPAGSTPALTPRELIEQSLAEITGRVSLRDSPGPASHTVIVATGLDDPIVATAVARYAVAFLAGWVQRNATIGAQLAVAGVEHRDEVMRLVERIVGRPEGLDADGEDNWRRTWRNAWIAEVTTHALFVIRKATVSPFLEGSVVGLLRPHPLPKRQGLDTVAIYDEHAVAVVAVGETKASCEHGSDELTNACDLFSEVDDGLYGPDLRDALDSLAGVLPASLADQVSDSLWREARCYVPAIFHQAEFDASRARPRLAQLIPPRERKRVLMLRLAEFDMFFDSVASRMPGAVAELVV
jgi:hypothetical protein